jgi:hydroxymethylbilane synthase
MILKPDGSDAVETALRGARGDAAEIGAQAGRSLKDRAGPNFF